MQQAEMFWKVTTWNN